MIEIRKALEDRVSTWEQIGHPDLIARFALKHGRGFVPAPLAKRRIGEPKMCYMNAAKLALAHDGYTYVEGFAVNREIGFIFDHAWVTDQAMMQAFDPTIVEAYDYQYFGVPIPKAVLSASLIETGTYGVFDTGAGVNVGFMGRWDPEFSKDKLETMFAEMMMKRAKWQLLSEGSCKNGD